MKEVHNFHIPDSILPRSEDIKCIEDLTFFNELCQNICRFDEQKMKQLSMAVEFVGVKDFTDMTYIARTLSEFEIHPGVHSDEEYGKYLVSDEGLFDVDDLLLPYIDYAGLARDKRQGTLTDSEYVSEGFVGANRDIHEYMEYEGELEVLSPVQSVGQYTAISSHMIRKEPVVFQNGNARIMCIRTA